MGGLTFDLVLDNIRAHLHLSKETESEVLLEIRTHLEDAVTEAVARGEDPQAALSDAAENFGIEEAGAELQEVHAGWESIEAVAATALPVLLAIILRWLVFAPGGSALDWPRLLVPPGFWLVASAALLVPMLLFRHRRFVLVGWGFFWLITVIFLVFPTIIRW